MILTLAETCAATKLTPDSVATAIRIHDFPKPFAWFGIENVWAEGEILVWLVGQIETRSETRAEFFGGSPP